jgi:hypothetical protein
MLISILATATGGRRNYPVELYRLISEHFEKTEVIRVGWLENTGLWWGNIIITGFYSKNSMNLQASLMGAYIYNGPAEPH